MKKSSTPVFVAALAGLFAFLILFPSESRAQSQYISRFAANFILWDKSEQSAAPSDTPASGGIEIYDNTVKVPADINTLFVTFSGTGDGHDGAATLLSCEVGGNFCNPGEPFSGAPGWVNLQRHGSTQNLHDNNVRYTWCLPIKPNKKAKFPLQHEVQLFLASSGEGDVFVEQAHILIDGAKIQDKTGRCTDLTPLD